MFCQVCVTLCTCLQGIVSEVGVVDSPKKRMKAAVAMCKLSDWDPDVFFSVRDIFLAQVLHFPVARVLLCLMWEIASRTCLLA